MSNGPIIQLVAKGQQDSDLFTNEVKSSLFLPKYNKITNFAKHSYTLQAEGHADCGNTIKFTIDKSKGDLLNGLYVVFELPEISVADIDEDPLDSDYRVKWADFLGNVIIEKATLKFNGNMITDDMSEYIQITTDLYDDDLNKIMLMGNNEILNKPSLTIESDVIYVPLRFWFCNKIENSLPLIAMQYTNIEVEIKLRRWENIQLVLKENNGLLVSSTKTLPKKPLGQVRMEANYILLDLEERKRIAQSNHKLLITQSQHIQDSAVNKSIDLHAFNKPVKELFFIIQRNNNKPNTEYYNYSTKDKFPDSSFEDRVITKTLWDDISVNHNLRRARILMNGHEFLEWKDHKFFYYLQNYEHYKNPMEHYCYLYSFASDPSEFGHTGSCNFSRIDNSQIQYELYQTTTKVVNRDYNYTVEVGPGSDATIHVFATNYNNLIIEGGIAAVEYSN